MGHKKCKLAAPGEGSQQSLACAYETAGKRQHLQEQQRAWAKRPRWLCGGDAAGERPDGHPAAGAPDLSLGSLSHILPEGWWTSEDLLPTAWESLSGAGSGPRFVVYLLTALAGRLPCCFLAFHGSSFHVVALCLRQRLPAHQGRAALYTTLLAQPGGRSRRG